jgi:hypothetical protein
MVRVVEYYNQFQGVRTRLTGLPPWARSLIFLASLPGVLLVALSILAFLVSILALLLLTVPLYRLLKLITGVEDENRAVPAGSAGTGFGLDFGSAGFGSPDFGSPGRKRVDATVTDAAANDAPAAGQGL